MVRAFTSFGDDGFTVRNNSKRS